MSLDAIGDFLNWAVAGIVFPLMFLPLAALIESRRPTVLPIPVPTGAVVWLGIVIVVVATALGFVRLAPRLDVPGDLGSGMIVWPALIAAQAMAIAICGGAARATKSLALAFERIAGGAGRLVMWLTLVMALVQFGVVILRYVFGINSIFMQESIVYMHGAVFLVAAGYALLTDDHVRVDIFYRAASPKRKALVNLVGTYLFLFPILLVALWTGSEYVAHSWSVREGSTEQSGIQGVYLLKTLVPVFAILLAMAGFTTAARAGETLRGER